MATAVLAGAALFLWLGYAVGAGLTAGFDSAILLSVRDTDDLSVPRGPHWLFAAMRDITALGDSPVLTLVTAIAAGYAVSRRRVAEAAFIAFTAASGAIVDTQLKLFYGRPRPDLTPHLVDVISPSFPSGHAMNSAVVCITLCAVLLRHTTGSRSRAYIAGIGIMLTGLVGASRAYLGVHYPTDIIAGWAAGSAWALGCWLAATRLVPALASRRSGTGERGGALPLAVHPAKAPQP